MPQRKEDDNDNIYIYIHEYIKQPSGKSQDDFGEKGIAFMSQSLAETGLVSFGHSAFLLSNRLSIF